MVILRSLPLGFVSNITVGGDFLLWYILLFVVLTGDYTKKKGYFPIPEQFPGMVLLLRDDDAVGGYALSPTYRKELTPEFEYFVERMMTSIHAKRISFRSNRHKKLSEIFTESDEAFALCLLRNEFEGWKQKTAQIDAAEEQDTDIDDGQEDSASTAQQGPRRLYIQKPFSDRQSGVRTGWNEQGLRLYNSMIEQISILRETPESRAIEATIVEKYKNKCSIRASKQPKKKETEQFDPLETLRKSKKSRYSYLFETAAV